MLYDCTLMEKKNEKKKKEEKDGKEGRMLKVNNKDTRTTSLVSFTYLHL